MRTRDWTLLIFFRLASSRLRNARSSLSRGLNVFTPDRKIRLKVLSPNQSVFNVFPSVPLLRERVDIIIDGKSDTLLKIIFQNWKLKMKNFDFFPFYLEKVSNIWREYSRITRYIFYNGKMSRVITRSYKCLLISNWKLESVFFFGHNFFFF